MHCESCGAAAPTQFAELHQNIGMLFMRQSRHVHGHLCRACIERYFWQFTPTTLLLGWWGLISFFITPVYLIGNISTAIKARRLPAGRSPVATTASQPGPERMPARGQTAGWAIALLVGAIVFALSSCVLGGALLLLAGAAPAGSAARTIFTLLILAAIGLGLLMGLGTAVLLGRRLTRQPAGAAVPSVVNGSPVGTGRLTGAPGDGPARAIVIAGSSEGTAAEQRYLMERFGPVGQGWTMLGQALHEQDHRYYDVVTIRLASGAQQAIWFDITAFHGGVGRALFG